jgi:large subunit ribosomal protein L9
MKIILQKPVGNLGTPGQVVEVADGYARNYLIPRGLAAPASKGGVRHAERLARMHEQRSRKEIDEARQTMERISASPIRMRAKAGQEGRLFGSITVADVAEEIQRSTGVEVDRRKIHLDEPIRSLGAHELSVRLHPEVEATVTVEVVPQ